MCRLASARRCYTIQRTECELDSGMRVDSWEFRFSRRIFAPHPVRSRGTGGPGWVHTAAEPLWTCGGFEVRGDMD